MGRAGLFPRRSLIALSLSANQVRLSRSATGRTIAHLTTLQALRPGPAGLQPRRHPADRFDQPADRLDLGPEADPRAIADDGPRLGPAALSAGGGISGSRPSSHPLDPRPRRGARARGPPRGRAGRVRGAAARTSRRRRRPAGPRLAQAAACRNRPRRSPTWSAACGSGPTTPTPCISWPRRRSQTNDRAAARATLEKYLAHAGDDTDARALKGQLALQLGRLQEADDDYSKVLDLDPGRDRVRFGRAQIRLRLGRLEDALADLDPLVPSYPQDANLLGLRSQVHERLGHREQALADLKQAAELPEAPARVLQQSGLEAGHRPGRLARSPAGAGPGPQGGRAVARYGHLPQHAGRRPVPRGPVCRGHRHPGEEPRGRQGRVRRLRPVLPGHGPIIGSAASPRRAPTSIAP